MWSRVKLPPQFQLVSQLWGITYPFRPEILSVLEDIAKFSSYISNAALQSSGSIYKNFEFSFQNLIPLLHRLLDLSVARIDMDHVGNMMQEAVRLGCLLYMAGIKRIFGFISRTPKTISHKIYVVLQRGVEDWAGFEILYLWCLAMGAMESFGEDKRWFLSTLKNELNAHGRATLEEGLDVLRSFIWFEEAHTPLYLQTVRSISRSGEDV